VPPADSPTWRKLFDGVEKRISPPLTVVTSSSDLHLVMQRLAAAKRAVTAPAGSAASWGLHLVGLPSLQDVRDLKRQLGEVERDLLALQRDLANESDTDDQDPE
jgi:hypothetical protein